MTLADAIALLGVASGDDQTVVRARYRDLMRQHHPDVADAARKDDSTGLNASLVTEAYAVITSALASAPDGCIPSVGAVSEVASAERTPRVHSAHDGDTIFIEVPPDEAYQRLLDAAAQLGGIGHVDRNLGLLEVIVRFEGGPSCSVLMTLQGRAHRTDVFIEMESIEAAPTPPIAPVLDALVELLGSGD